MQSSRYVRSVITAGVALALLGSAGPAIAAAEPSNPESQVLAQVNDDRSKVGCGPVTVDGRLTEAAARHSSDMAAQGYFSHTGRDGSDFVRRANAAGHPSPGAENIAMGQPDANAVMDAWLKSPGHRENIENCSLRTMGVGLDGNGMYWTQDFGR